MFSWAQDFFIDHSSKFANYSLVFAFGDLLIGTFLNLAFGGLIKFRVKLHLGKRKG